MVFTAGAPALLAVLLSFGLGLPWAPTPWRCDQATDTQLVAGALQVTLHDAEVVSEKLSSDTPGEEVVVTDGAAFEAILASASARAGMGAAINVRRGARRSGVRAWALITAVAVPLALVAYTVLLPRAHVFVSKELKAALGEYVDNSSSGQLDPIADEELLALLQRMTRERSDPLAGCELRVTFIRQRCHGLRLRRLRGGGVGDRTVERPPRAEACARARTRGGPHHSREAEGRGAERRRLRAGPYPAP